jgi:hypothetical protein
MTTVNFSLVKPVWNVDTPKEEMMFSKIVFSKEYSVKEI